MKKFLSIASLTAFVVACSFEGEENATDVTGEWQHAGGNHFNEKYAPLDQINARNFAELEIAWRWVSADSRLPQDLSYPTGDYRAVPLVVEGVMYVNTNHGQVAALDPSSGEELWIFDPQSYRLGPPLFSPAQTRGIEYWTDGEIQRIFIATLGKQLVSIDILSLIHI